MANHSAQYPDGYLDKKTFKSFFAVSGDSGSFTYQAGVRVYQRCPSSVFVSSLEDYADLRSILGILNRRQRMVLTSDFTQYERIPDNWYKRPVGDEYTIPGYALPASIKPRFELHAKPPN